MCIRDRRKGGRHKETLTYRTTGGHTTGKHASMTASQAYPREFGRTYGSLVASNYYSSLLKSTFSHVFWAEQLRCIRNLLAGLLQSDGLTLFSSDYRCTGLYRWSVRDCKNMLMHVLIHKHPRSQHCVCKRRDQTQKP